MYQQSPSHCDTTYVVAYRQPSILESAIALVALYLLFRLVVVIVGWLLLAGLTIGAAILRYLANRLNATSADAATPEDGPAGT